ncbi:ATP-binding protein [Aurantimonas sp. Leaf443]|uniref:hybrid sensor histidine kinase/response regulator n=1 Tax=Aurantimonas sp. Leaf443 TaxID=1736378 RepID=UPI0006F65948|nr:ATP-binding protein [Aurantimonas sp. Leaf443]KQT85760.1 hypothetical protein ASG48_03825 [Aurantimonas sp. Leaf443]
MTPGLAVGREAVRRSTRATWLSLATSVLLLALLLAAYVNLADRSRSLQDGIREDALWAVYQIGRESGTLAEEMRDALADGRLDGAEREALTLRYDIVYSRMSVVDNANYGAYFAEDDDIRALRTAVRTGIVAMEPVFDAVTSADAEALAALVPTATDLVETSESLLLRTNSVVSAARADARAEVLRLQHAAAWIVLALVVSFGLLVLSLAYRLRATRAIGDELQSVAEQLTAAFAAAEAGNKAKSEFMATMGHEIRTPLNAILGMAELLSMSDLARDDRESVAAIRSSGTALLEIINEILDFAKIEHGDTGSERVLFDPAELLREAAVVVHGRARERGNAVKIAEGDVAGLYMGDPTRLRRVLLNLLSNAVKFTENGVVRVKLSQTGSANDPRLRFEITDSGIGIAPESRHRLFLPFSQVDGSIGRRFGGTGLGLAICKRIVEAAGGEIGVDSEPGVGSRFWFEIPAAPAPADARRPHDLAGEATAPAISRHILVVEDNAFNRRVAGRFLEKLGHTAEFCENGRDAVERVRQGRFDLVLMDMQMPVMDGIEATRAIRALPGEARSVPVVALTANASESDRERCIAVGMEGFETKPMPMDRLRLVIERWGGRRAAAPVEAAPPALDDEAQAAPPPGVDIDEARVADLVEAIGEDGLAELREAFADDAAALLGDLRASMEANDAARTDAVLHTIKGAASNIGYRRLAALAQAMRRESAAPDLHGRLVEEVRQLTADVLQGERAA